MYMVTRLGGYEMIPGFLKDISFYPYSRVFGRNWIITDAYFCHWFLFFDAMRLRLLRLPFVSFSLLKMNICYT
jgi:hypothetical protein